MLKGGALANNVYWQVAGAVSFGAGAKYVGTFLGAGAVALGEGASIKGRVLTPGTVALADSPFAISKDDLTPPVVSIDGGGTSARTTPHHRSREPPTSPLAATWSSPWPARS